MINEADAILCDREFNILGAVSLITSFDEHTGLSIQRNLDEPLNAYLKNEKFLSNNFISEIRREKITKLTIYAPKFT